MKEWRSHLVIESAPTPTPMITFETVEAGDSSYTVNEIRDPAPPRYQVEVGKRLVAIDITQVELVDGARHIVRSELRCRTVMGTCTIAVVLPTLSRDLDLADSRPNRESGAG